MVWTKKQSQEHWSKYYKENREDLLLKSKQYKLENRDRLLSRRRELYLKNKEMILEKQRKRRLANPNKKRTSEQGRIYHANYRSLESNREKERQAAKGWRKKNPHKCNVYSANKRATKLMATPAWLNKEQKAEIVSIYKKATELSLTVDHIIPLKGKTVSGLHVPWNLQLLDCVENSRKNNSLIY